MASVTHVDFSKKAGGSSIARPKLTMPEAEAARLRAAYEAADVILEYGSGGSTVMAGEMPGKRITTVESDKDWSEMMRGWFTENPPVDGTEVDIFWADIGPTKEWGHPVNDEYWRNFAAYPLGIWDIDDLPQPDVVLVDGRFREGCALATALNTKKPVELFFDDYAERKHYHVVERWLGKPDLTGRMAHFSVSPLTLDPRDLLRVMDLMTRP